MQTKIDGTNEATNASTLNPGSGDGRSYANEISSAVTNFTSPNGIFTFTSSGGVYTENLGGIVDENSDVVQVRKCTRFWFKTLVLFQLLIFQFSDLAKK